MKRYRDLKPIPKLVIVAIVAAGGFACYKAVGDKVTPGNILGLRVGRIAVVDVANQKAYDENGKDIPMKDAFVSDYTNPIRRENSDPRILKVEIPYAQVARITWGEVPAHSTSSLHGQFEFKYPLLDSSASIPYQIEASADNWHEIESFDPKHLPKNVSISETSGNVSALCTLKVGIDPSQPRSEYRLVIEPGNDSSYTSTLGDSSEFFVRDSEKIDLSRVTRLSLQRRDFKVAAKGLLACGAVPSESNRFQLPTGVSVLSVSAPFRGGLQNRKWNQDGTSLPYSERQRTLWAPGNNEERKRYLSVALGVGSEYLDHPYFQLHSTKTLVQGGTDDAVIVCEKGHIYNLNFYADEDVETTDLNLDIASGSYNTIMEGEVIDVPRGKEPAGNASYELKRSHDAGHVYDDFEIRVPKEFSNQNYKVLYEGFDGKLHDPQNYSTSQDGYVGFDLFGKESRRKEVKKVIVQARPYRTVTLKNVHLFPNGARVNKVASR